MRKRMHIAVFLAVSSAYFAGPAAAQGDNKRGGDTLVAQAGELRCRKDVKDYVSAMRFVREQAGAQVGDKVAGSYVSEEQLEKVAAAQGPCAAAQLLRDKGAVR